MPPSSPTPYRHSIPLVPSSPFSSTSNPFRRRQRLRSSSGDTIIKGLSNWRRQAKSTSQSASTAGTQDQTRFTHNNENDHKLTSSKKRKSKGSGLGMGMRGTPAKIVKRSSKASIGPTSTPIANTKKRSEGEDTTLDSSTRSSTTSSHLLTAEEITSPSISAFGTSPILPLTQRRGNTLSTLSGHTPEDDSLFSPSQRGRSRHDDTLLPAQADLVIPLNDLTSTSSRSTSNVDETTPKAGSRASLSAEVTRSTIQGDERILEDDNDDGRWELTIPLSDLSQSKKRRLPRSSSGSSKIKERRSTPRKIPGMDKTPSISDTSTISETSVRRRHGATVERPEERHSLEVSVETVRGFESDVEAPMVAPQNQSNNDRDVEYPLGIDSEDLPQDESHTIEMADAPPASPRQTSPAPSFSDSGDDFADTAAEFPLTPTKVKIHVDKSTSTGSTSTDWNPGDDPYGFEWMEDIVREKIPQPYHLSSGANTPGPAPSPSPISFSTNISTPPISRDPSPEVEKRRSAGTVKGIWKGAQVMKRIERGEIPHIDEEDSQEETDEESDDETRSRRKKSKARESSDIPESTEEAIQARQARIAHYIDLAENYELHVEYVLW
ncbi:hypothetical protein V865_001424 [Kwoniella europaea PYCC6329]|uniref:Uncharacterized protein n=1 Tax=Kwoniella europaea PYCC6329 TaxID=1423913 RepID=A0AAX4KA75_9TREE